MRIGFEIKIEDGLTVEEEKVAKDFATRWAIGVMKNDGSWRERTSGGWRSYLKRGVFGKFIEYKPDDNHNYDDLIFRRMSKHQRIFGILRAKHMKTLSGDDVNLNQCMCPMHRGGVRVTIPDMPKMKSYIRYGEVKG